MSRSLSVKEVSEIYGFSRRTLYYWLQNRTLPHVRIGTRVFIEPEDIEALKKRNRIEPEVQR